MRIKVIVPAWNCMRYLPRCLDSVASQDDPSFDVVVIDDASTDWHQAPFVRTYCEEEGWTAVLNDKNRKCPYNLRAGINAVHPDDDDVIFLLDGDDFLPHARVLSTIRAVYDEDPNLWITYGQYEPYPERTGQHPAEPYPREVIEQRSFRSHGNILFNHPLTFKHGLWRHVEDTDLQNPNGEWFRGGYDKLIMYPMLEMAAERHRCLEEVLYMYNAENPKSDNLVNRHLIAESDEIYDRPIKPRLDRW